MRKLEDDKYLKISKNETEDCKAQFQPEMAMVPDFGKNNGLTTKHEVQFTDEQFDAKNSFDKDDSLEQKRNEATSHSEEQTPQKKSAISPSTDEINSKSNSYKFTNIFDNASSKEF